MKRILRFAVAAVILLAVLLGLAALATLTGVELRPGRGLPASQATVTRLEQPPAGTNTAFGPLRAGFGRAKLTPTLNAAADRPEQGEFRALPLAGYGNRQGKPAEGVHDDVWVKAIAFAVGGQTGVMVLADALIIPREVSDLAMKDLAAAGLTRPQVYFGATHTHCSLGGWGEGFVGEAFAGPFQPAVRIWFAHQLVQAAKAAVADLSPASLGSGSFAAPQFIRNRLVGDQGQIDAEFPFLVVRQADGDRAVLGSFGAHATVLGGGVMQFSGDYPGAWQAAVEKATGGMALFVAGGVGSHSHKAPKGGFEGVEAMGEALAAEVLQRLPAVALTNRITFGVTGIEAALPDLQVRVTDDVRLRPWVAARLLPVSDRTFLQGFRFDQVVWLSTPCDFSGELALELKAAWADRGVRPVVTSFNGDYVGYVIPAKYYHRPGYEPRTMSFFGPQLPDYFMDLLDKLTKALVPRP